ncbi:MAG: cation:proton antiporter [Gemmataceae bacterium]
MSASPRSRPTAISSAVSSRTIVAYAVMVAACIGAFLIIRAYGESLQTPAGAAVTIHPAGDAANQGDALLHVLIALAAVILVGRILSRLFIYIGQPPVIGEVVAGLLLGPSLLGTEASALILPPAVAPYLSVIAQVGVILYMFLVGLELNLGRLRTCAHITLTVSHASMAAPFLCGAGLALWLYPRYAQEGVPFTSFALFIGVALAVTAFPVLARILSDRGLTQTELGVIALGCAATNDVTAWCLLAFVVGVAQAKVEGALLVAGLALGFIALMFVVIRPIIKVLVKRLGDGLLSTTTVAWVFLAVLVSAVVSEAIGIHAIFGAFLLGAVIPHDSAIAKEFTHKLEDIVTVLLLPAFFAITGMRTEIGLLAGWENWLACGLILIAATVGKFGGTVVAARLTGLDWHMASSLGFLMNTRGLMELIVLNIGLNLGVISPTVFAMMVLMALITTMATSPLLMLVNRDSLIGQSNKRPNKQLV